MIALVYDVILGFITLSFFDGDCTTYLKDSGGKPGRTCIGFAWLRRLRVRYAEYWHPV